MEPSRRGEMDEVQRRESIHAEQQRNRARGDGGRREKNKQGVDSERDGLGE